MREDELLWEEIKKSVHQSDYEQLKSQEFIHLGWHTNYVFRKDIKHLAFTLSRYKFVSKLLLYREKIKICELGCNEALGALMFEQDLDLEKFVGIDFDKDSIMWNKKYLEKPTIEFQCANFFGDLHLDLKFDAVINLDVIEHIDKNREDEFCKIIQRLLTEDGVAIVGTPSIAMTPYASEESKMGHVNLFDQKRLHDLMSKYFKNVFIFNMNDEVVHTGFSPMSCYIFAVCTGVKC